MSIFPGKTYLQISRLPHNCRSLDAVVDSLDRQLLRLASRIVDRT